MFYVLILHLYFHVAKGIYVRKNTRKPGYHQSGTCKQQSASGVEVQEKRKDLGEHKTERSLSTEKPAHSHFVKKSLKPMPHVNNIPRKFDKGGQSSIQASVLIEQLTNEKYECMVCCEVIKCSKAVWFCSSCYHIFHLFCIRKWARSPSALVEGKKYLFCMYCTIENRGFF